MSIQNLRNLLPTRVRGTPLLAGLLAVGAALPAFAQDAAQEVGKGGFSEQATLGQVIEFQLTGLLVVFTVLGGLTILCYVLAWLLKTIAPSQYYGKAGAPGKPVAPAAPVKPAAVAAPAPVANAAAAPAAAAPVASIHPGLTDAELIAILAVAATEGVGQAVNIVRFRPQGNMDWTWSVQGRVGLHTSHTP